MQRPEQIQPQANPAIPAPAHGRSAIELRDVSVYFGDHPALNGVSLSLIAGGTVMLLGPTASGKSVLLKTALGLLKPDSGQVLVDGVDLAPLPEKDIVPIRRKMGIVFQEGALFDSLSVFENVAYRLREERLDESAIEQRVREVLRFVEMEAAIDKMPAELSGGMRRRVSIARAIASEPNIMLYDSPTGGLDPVTSQTLNRLILKLRDVQKVSSIVVTHRLQDAYFLANYSYSTKAENLVPLGSNGERATAGLTQFVILREGSVYFHGTEKELVGSTDPYLRKFIV